MKSTKLLKLFLILSIFSICPINAIEKKASFAGLGSFIKAKTISAVHSLQSKITLKNNLYLLGGILVVGGILHYLLWPKYKAYKKGLEKRKVREALERERKEREREEKEASENLNINDKDSLVDFIKRVTNTSNIPKEIDMAKKFQGSSFLFG